GIRYPYAARIAADEFSNGTLSKLYTAFLAPSSGAISQSTPIRFIRAFSLFRNPNGGGRKLSYGWRTGSSNWPSLRYESKFWRTGSLVREHFPVQEKLYEWS